MAPEICTDKQKALFEIHGISEREYEKRARDTAVELTRDCRCIELIRS